jgi:4-amino-4-deoxy-L-arabinose transferase-like glycosyltransferase
VSRGSRRNPTGGRAPAGASTLAVASHTRRWPRGLAVALLLAAGFLLRLWTAHAYWRWFDGEFPGAWQRSRVILSQDGTQYVQQADPDTWQRPYRGPWQERPYYRPPLASYVFAFLCRVTGFDRLALSAIQALLALLAYLLICRLVARAFGYWTAVASLAWSLLYPPLVYFDVSFEDSALALALLALAVAAFVRSVAGPPWRLVAAGTLMGLAILARPNTALACVSLVGVLLAAGRDLAPRRRLAAALAFAAPVLILAALPTWHNYRTSGRFAFVVDTNGENLFWGNAARAEDRILLQGFWDIPQVDAGSPGWLLIRDLTTRHGERSIDRAFRAEAWSHVRAQPLAVAGGLVLKAARHFASYEIPRNEDLEALRQAAPVFRWPYVPYPVTACLALIGLVSVPPLLRRLSLILLAPWICAFVTEVVYFNASRYRATSLPFLIPFAVLGLVRCYEELCARRFARVGLALAALALSSLAGQRIVSPLERRQHLSAQAFKAAMVEAYADEAGRLRVPDAPRFLGRLRTALDDEPRNLDARVVLVKSLLATGRRAEAIRIRDEGCRVCAGDDRLCELVCAELASLGTR